MARKHNWVGRISFTFLQSRLSKASRVQIVIFISARRTRAMGIWGHLRVGINSGEILHLKPLSSRLHWQLSKCTVIRKHFEAQDALYIAIIRLCHQYSRLTVQFRMLTTAIILSRFQRFLEICRKNEKCHVVTNHSKLYVSRWLCQPDYSITMFWQL